MQAQYRGAQARAPGTRSERDGLPECVGEHLSPDSALGKATRSADLVDRVACLPDRFEDKGELLTDALKRGANEVRPTMPAREPDEGTPGLSIPVRSSFPVEIREHDQSIAARRRRQGLIEQRIPPIMIEFRSARRSQPVDRRATIVDGTARRPEVVGERVAEEGGALIDSRLPERHPQSP